MVEPFHKHLNCIEPCIQFTVEEESGDRKLPFLDVQLCRDCDGTVTTSVYRKATHTNQYLSFTSHRPTAHKVAVVRTLMTRANTLSSSGVERVQEEKQIVEALQENGYPPPPPPASSTNTRTQGDQDGKWMTRGPEQP